MLSGLEELGRCPWWPVGDAGEPAFVVARNSTEGCCGSAVVQDLGFVDDGDGLPYQQPEAPKAGPDLLLGNVVATQLPAPLGPATRCRTGVDISIYLGSIRWSRFAPDHFPRVI